MWDCILDGIIDTLKLLPFLFIVFLLLEFIEHKLSNKSKNIEFKKVIRKNTLNSENIVYK